MSIEPTHTAADEREARKYHEGRSRAYDFGFDDATTAIVTWLVSYPPVIGLTPMAAWNTAAAIQRGDHLPQGMEAQRAATSGAVHDSPVACDAALSPCNLNHNGGD